MEGDREENRLVEFNDVAILKDTGKVTHEIAVALAEKEFEKYAEIHDKIIESDFDKVIKLTKDRST